MCTASDMICSRYSLGSVCERYIGLHNDVDICVCTNYILNKILSLLLFYAYLCVRFRVPMCELTHGYVYPSSNSILIKFINNEQ